VIAVLEIARLALGNLPWWADALVTLTALACWLVVQVARAVLPQDSADRLAWWREMLRARSAAVKPPRRARRLESGGRRAGPDTPTRRGRRG
jgi:hypothetical protein